MDEQHSRSSGAAPLGGDRRSYERPARTCRTRCAGAVHRAHERTPTPTARSRHYSRATLDRWIRAWRRGGLEALRPETRSDTGAVRAHPELADEAAALRLELPSRARPPRSLGSSSPVTASAWPSARCANSSHAVGSAAKRWPPNRRPSAATRRRGRTTAGSPTCSSDPGSRTRRVASSVRAKLFLIVDDHSRLLVHGRFFAHENARACQEALRTAIVHRGLPEVLYADNGAPFKNAWLTRTCAVLGVRLVHSKPYSPEGRGKQERLNRFIREAFLQEAMHQGIVSLVELDDLFDAWAEQVANRRSPRRDQ